MLETKSKLNMKDVFRGRDARRRRYFEYGAGYHIKVKAKKRELSVGTHPH